jgi:curved DNA-binding protein CbpA
MDYCELLRLTPTASPREIKQAYYRDSRIYHPDRFARLADEPLKETINSIFKRVTEAYVVLRDDKKRAKYLSDIAGPDRAKKLRYTEESEAEKKAAEKKALEEQVGTTPKGREAFKSGMKEFGAKRFDAAIRHFKMALMYETRQREVQGEAQGVRGRVGQGAPEERFPHQVTALRGRRSAE